MVYRCNFCGKKYSREGFYKRHELSCEIKNLGKRKQNEDQEEDYTQNEASIIIRELVQQVHSLKGELEDLKMWVQKQKRKCNIIDWLEKSCVPTIGYQEWVNAFVVKQDHLDKVLRNSYIEGITYTFQKMFPIEHNEDFPIKCFEQKQNVFYIYEKESGWKYMHPGEFESMVLKVQKQLISLLKLWEKNNKNKASNQNYELYFKYVTKVMGGKQNQEVTQKKIVSNLYDYLKYNLREIVEYDFVF